MIEVSEKDLATAMWHWGYYNSFKLPDGSLKWVKDLGADGYTWLSKQYLEIEAIEPELQHFGANSDGDTAAVMKCSILIRIKGSDGETHKELYSAVGDTNDRATKVTHKISSIADTVAYRRAMARVFGITKDMLQKYDVPSPDEQQQQQPQEPESKPKDEGGEAETETSEESANDIDIDFGEDDDDLNW